MAMQGKLTRDEIAHTMPVDAPSYQTKPFYYKRARVHSFVFETDPEAAASPVPAQLKLTETVLLPLSPKADLPVLEARTAVVAYFAT